LDTNTAPTHEKFFPILEQTNGQWLNPNSKLNDDWRPDKSIKLKGIVFKPKFISYSVPKIKTYFQYNNLDFNLPFICYKFPRSEHSEEG
jgi:hypothetical protein